MKIKLSKRQRLINNCEGICFDPFCSSPRLSKPDKSRPSKRFNMAPSNPDNPPGFCWFFDNIPTSKYCAYHDEKAKEKLKPSIHWVDKYLKGGDNNA